MARLTWINYEGQDSQKRNYLFLELGTSGGNICGLIADKISPQEITLIRQNAEVLSKMELEEIMEWLRKSCPDSIKAFRTLKPDKMVVLNAYPLKSFGSST